MTRTVRAAPEQLPRAIIYVRQSIARDDSVSLELQETAGRDHAARRGYQVVGVVADPGRTGTTLKRRQVLATISRIENGEADIIIVWRWSRLARSRRDFAVVCDTVESLGGRVESATEHIDTTTASGRFARGMMAEVAAWESEQKGEVWKEIHARRRGNGLVAQGGPRFGYTHQRGTNTYTIDPVTGPILAELYRRNIDGEGCRRLATWLNDHDIRTVGGGRWTNEAVRRILTSGFGAGKVVVHSRTPGARTYFDGAHEPVITDKDWRAYLRRTALKVPPDLTTEPRYMLSGKLVCGDCGKKLHAHRLGKQPGFGFACSTWLKSRLCRCITVTRHRAEAAVRAFLTDLAGDIDAAQRRADLAGERRVIARSTTKDLSRRLAQLDERLTRLTVGWTEQLVPDSAYRAARDEITGVKEKLLRELDHAERAVETVPVRPSLPVGVLDVWDRLPTANQRAILKPLIDRVEVIRPTVPSGRPRNRIVIHTTWGERFTSD